ncbi:MAG: glycosyltransferase [Ignavibacteriales bacterium]|nr:glycosyltransferase [Ignavibacteriales bacterium]
MSYRFVKISTFYRDFLRKYYDANPGIGAQPYEAQYSHLMSMGYAWSGYFSHYLSGLGQEAYDIVGNAEGLQSAWAREHGVEEKGAALVAEQIRILKPTVVMFQDSFTYHGRWIEELRKAVPSIQLVLGWCCSPYSEDFLSEWKCFDAVLCCSPLFVDDLQRKGIRTEYLPHGFETSLVPRLSENNIYPASDVAFLGSLIPGAGFHDVRKQLLEALLSADVALAFYGAVTDISQNELMRRQAGYVTAVLMKQFGLRDLAAKIPGIQKALSLGEMPHKFRRIEKLKAAAQPPIYGLEMLKMLSRAKIGFNNHGDVAGNFAANMRMFEVTGAGACLVTDAKENMHEFFEEGREVITYRSAEECIEKIRWLLDHPAECRAIAEAGQRRTLKDHTIEQRVGRLHDIISHLLK